MESVAQIAWVRKKARLLIASKERAPAKNQQTKLISPRFLIFLLAYTLNLLTHTAALVCFSAVRLINSQNNDPELVCRGKTQRSHFIIPGLAYRDRTHALSSITLSFCYPSTRENETGPFLYGPQCQAL